jgi:hypothetical protein
MTVGSDGNVWFSEMYTAEIGRITSAGTITEFGGLTSGSTPQAITLGPDGNVWFVETTTPKVGSMTPSGVLTEYTITYPMNSIAAGPDGNLWVGGGSYIGRMTTSGAATWFSIPTANASAWDITAGPDGNMWFVEYMAPNLGRVTPAGVITEFPVGTQYAIRIATAPGGPMWLDDTSGVSRVDFGCPRPTPDAGAPDAGSDASVGVTCTVERATPGVCSDTITVEQNVSFFYVTYDAHNGSGPDPKGAIGTLSPGISAFYDMPPSATNPLFIGANSHTIYQGYTAADGYGTVSGSSFTFSMNAGRGFISNACTPPLYLIDVQCSGTTTLAP